MQGDGPMEYADFQAECEAQAEGEYQASMEEQQNLVSKKLIGNMDAKVWAEEFVKVVKTKPLIPTDEGTMIGWFANAIMAGYDNGCRNTEDKLGVNNG